MKFKLLSILSAVLTTVGLMVSSSASFFIFYQPKAPKNLK